MASSSKLNEGRRSFADALRSNGQVTEGKSYTATRDDANRQRKNASVSSTASSDRKNQRNRRPKYREPANENIIQLSTNEENRKSISESSKEVAESASIAKIRTSPNISGISSETAPTMRSYAAAVCGKILPEHNSTAMTNLPIHSPPKDENSENDGTIICTLDDRAMSTATQSPSVTNQVGIGPAISSTDPFVTNQVGIDPAVSSTEVVTNSGTECPPGNYNRGNGSRVRNFGKKKSYVNRRPPNFTANGTNTWNNNASAYHSQFTNSHPIQTECQYIGRHYIPTPHAASMGFSSPRFEHNSQGYLQVNQNIAYPVGLYHHQYPVGQQNYYYLPPVLQQAQIPNATHSPVPLMNLRVTAPSSHGNAVEQNPTSLPFRNANNGLTCPPVNIQIYSPRSGVPILVPMPSQSSQVQTPSSPGRELVHRFTPSHMGAEDLQDVEELGNKISATPLAFDTWSSAVVLMEQRRKIKEKIGLVIRQRYHVIQKISVGCYGDVFSALDTHDPNRKMVAIKFEVKGDESHFMHEKEFYKIYTSSNGNHEYPRGIGAVYYTGTEYGYKIVVMELLGPTLERLFNYCNCRFEKETVYQLGMQFISRLEQIHNRGFVHRDLKPENFLMGTGNNEAVCYLIDFGLSRRYRKLCKDGSLKHVKLRKRKNMIGTAKYCSILSHFGVELSRRDDLESLGYILIEFINGTLPWKDSRFRERANGYAKIRTCKEQTDWGEVCPEMKDWILYSRSLEYTEKPDYNRFRKFLKDYLAKDFPKMKRKSSRKKKEDLNLSTTADLLALQSLVDGASDCGVLLEECLREVPSQEERDEKEIPQTLDNRDFVLPMNRQGKHDQGVDPYYVFEWQKRKASSVSEKYTYDCLFSWCLPYGVFPIPPPESECSSVFSFLPGCGGFA